jgi:DNA-binding transcriptional LysR family regulator
MNDHQIECFLIAAEEKNFSRAAKRLFLTQPAITYQINTLEKELGVELFVRRSSGVELSPAGKAFSSPAKKLHNAYAAAQNAVSEYRASTQELVIGCPKIMTALDDLYSPLVVQMVEAFPQYHIVIRDAEAGEKTPQELADGVDCVIGFPPSDMDKKKMESLPLFQTVCYAAVSKRHPFYGKTELQEQDLFGHILFYGLADKPLAAQLMASVKEAEKKWKVGMKSEQAVEISEMKLSGQQRSSQLDSSQLDSAQLDLRAVESPSMYYPALAAGVMGYLLPHPYKSIPADACIPIHLTVPLRPTMVTYLRSEKRAKAAEAARKIQEIYRKAGY